MINKVSIKERFLRLLSYGGFGLSAIAIIATISEGPHPEPLSIMGISAAVGGFAFFLANRMKNNRLERSIINYILRRNQASIPEIMIDLNLTAKEALKAVERIEDLQLLGSLVTEEGEMVYFLNHHADRNMEFIKPSF